MKHFYLFALLLLCCSKVSFAQQKDTIPQKKDSLTTIKLAEYNTKLAVIEQERVQDSLERIELEKQLSSLKTTDNLKKEELLKKLTELNDREKERHAEKKKQVDALRSKVKGYPVTGFFNDTLFTIYANQGSFSARERAEAVTKRIEVLGDNYLFHTDSLKIAETDNTVDVVYNDIIITSISETDAIWNDSSRHELAKTFKKIISDEITRYRHETSFKTLATEIAWAAFVIVLLVLLIYFSNKLFRWTALKIDQQKGKWLNGIRFKNYDFLNPERQVRVLLFFNSITKWIFIIILIYIALPILFGIFPWTQDFAEKLFSYVLTPVKKVAFGVWNYMPNLVTIIVLVVIFHYVLKFLNFLKEEIRYGKLNIDGFYPDWANPTYQILRVLILAFLLVLIFPYLPGSDSDIFKGVSVFLGFLFTFGSMGSLSNIIAGIVLTYMRLFKIGDRVKIGDITGDIIEKSMLVTRIRTPKNEIISIPNSTIMNSHTINYTSDTPDRGLILYTTVTIGYDVPYKAVEKALLDAVDRTERLLKEPKPFVLQTSLDDFYVSYQINGYTRDANHQSAIYSDLHRNIQDTFNEAGIEIMSPHYRAARDGNTTTIPSDYLNKDYKPGGFNINFSQEHKDQ